MKIMYFKKHLFIIALIIQYNLFAVGPWVNNRGSMFSQTSFLFVYYNQIFNSQDKLIKTQNGRISDFSIRNYTEYSLSNRTLITAILPIRYLNYNNNSAFGLADIRLGGKTELFPKNSPLSAYYNIFIPTGYHKQELRSDYKVWGAEIGLATGFAKGKTYAQLSGGYRLRNGIPNQSIFELEIGRKFLLKKKNLYFIFNFDGAINQTKIEFNPEPIFETTQLYHPNAQYLSPGFKFLYNFKPKWWLTATTKFGVFARNIGAFPGLDIGIAYKIEK